MNGLFSSSKQFSFEAAHFLPQTAEDHPCSRVHGHSYRVTVGLESAVTDADGFVFDLTALAQFELLLTRHFDRRLLNEAVVNGENTTPERLAVVFFFMLSRLFGTVRRVASVTVHETATTSATFNPGTNGGLLKLLDNPSDNGNFYPTWFLDELRTLRSIAEGLF